MQKDIKEKVTNGSLHNSTETLQIYDMRSIRSKLRIIWVRQKHSLWNLI